MNTKSVLGKMPGFNARYVTLDKSAFGVAPIMGRGNSGSGTDGFSGSSARGWWIDDGTPREVPVLTELDKLTAKWGHHVRITPTMQFYWGQLKQKFSKANNAKWHVIGIDHNVRWGAQPTLCGYHKMDTTDATAHMPGPVRVCKKCRVRLTQILVERELPSGV